MAGAVFPCSVDDCNDKAECRGLCNKHYLRLLRHGNPLAGGRPLNRSAPKKPDDPTSAVKTGRDRNKQVILECRECGGLFNPRHTREETSKYCSIECDTVQRSYSDLELIELLYENVTIINGCWIWNGSRNPEGYGTLKHKGKLKTTHRLSYSLFNNKIPAGLHVCHMCDCRPCINPSHLFVGTHRDNMLDMRQKGRGVFGFSHPTSKDRRFTPDQIRMIRHDDRPLRKIALELGLSDTRNLFAIRSGKAYADVR